LTGSLPAELVQRKPDVLFTYTTPGALAAKQVITNHPHRHRVRG
jgi:hypothetical protein